MISIITPFYGQHRQLPELIRCLQDQTCKDFECVIWADGPDEWCKDHIATLGDSRFRYAEIPDGPHLDWGHYARDIGLNHACGELVCFLGSDSLVQPTYLERLSAPLRDAWDVSVCKIGHEKHGVIPKCFAIPLPTGEVDAMSFMVRTDIARRIGWIWKHYEADNAFLNAVLQSTPRWIFLDELLGQHR